jgi:hypothetical protein
MNTDWTSFKNPLGGALWWFRTRSAVMWAFLIVLALAIGVFAVGEIWRASLNERQSELARREAPAPSPMPPGHRERNDGLQLSSALDTELTMLAPANSINDVWVLTHLLAASHGVKLDKGEYRYIRQPGADFGQYEMSLPLQGDYVAIRAFLADLLAEQPGLALDEIGFSRNRISDADVTVAARMTLFLKPDPT